jgi:isopentenyl diphosphate isomerase/L-lactate dehydrogenase-like FMN-dependent dehydrogenase
MNHKFDFKDITIVPEVLSSISSRGEIDIYTDEGKLPLMVSPMDTVIDIDNTSDFRNLEFEICYLSRII